MEFHISRDLRDRLGLDETLFRYTGDVIFGNVAASRKLAAKLTEVRRAASGQAAEAVNAGALFAMGLIDEMNHALVAKYREETDPDVLQAALRWFAGESGEVKVEELLLRFETEFPSVAVYRGKTTAAEWLAGTTDGMANREAAFEELIMLWLANRNPAFQAFKELFADGPVRTGTVYEAVGQKLPVYFETRPAVDARVGTLLDALMAPILASPDSLTGQLDFIRENWADDLAKGPEAAAAMKRVLLAVDTLREEDIAIWMRFNPAGQDTYQHAAPGFGGEGFQGDEYVGFEKQFDGYDEFGGYFVARDGNKRRVRGGKLYSEDYQAPLNEYEAFSVDLAWMPNVVMMAKSTYVWLEQLSQKYGVHIHRLDLIPEQELQIMADRGMTALWLIGLWERSTASQTIKRLRGHADAVASAYSLKEYRIAEDLGGNAAYEGLRDKAGRFGIRLASDMVPNHMGIDSDWVIEHPEWFLSRPETPFPVYTFNGPDLSNDSRVEIKIEDHYFDQTDAAVAYRVKYHRDGTTRFIYHGNDGTTFAWNDTAQLDYSKAVVREQVMQTILYVARLFPIIRFDAAMVLAKRHVQRLWFPLPGAGGSIPSRAEDAISQEEFEAMMPVEFWREVVDRVAVEVPGTLLLAEAFWLLESYFVRTLGMHRVYNSAFMNMLRDEENAKYRSYLKKTVEFDPDILKRYVNFMSNPDERTAIDQFGDGDKYFGCSTLLATLPGLPMFGHGQVEGFTERYGMEYKQAKTRENPNEHLVWRHNHEIAPLLKRRKQFAESENFLLYDFWTRNGSVDENVFAYSNRWEGDRSIVVYNNAYVETEGTLHVSAASVEKASGQMKQRTLAEGLAIEDRPGGVVAWRDTVSGLEYVRRTGDVVGSGVSLPLRGYQYVVLLDWRELQSTTEQPWDRLADELGGRGVASVDEALKGMLVGPLSDALREAIDCDWGRAAEAGPEVAQDSSRLDAFVAKGSRFLELAGGDGSGIRAAALHAETKGVPQDSAAMVKAWVLVQGFGLERFDRLGLRAAAAAAFGGEEDGWRRAAMVRLALVDTAVRTAPFWEQGDARWLAGVNESAGKTYVHGERFAELMGWLSLVGNAAAAGVSMAEAGFELPVWLAGEAVSPMAAKKTVARKVTAGTVMAKKTAEVHLSDHPQGTLAGKRTKEPKGALKALVAKEIAMVPVIEGKKSFVKKTVAKKDVSKKTAAKKTAAKKSAAKKTSGPKGNG